MAKDPDKLATDLQTDDGLLGSVLAEEKESGRRLAWRLGTWGVVAVGAVAVAVMANQSALVLKRDQLAAADIAHQAQQLQSLAKESHNETRRLASAIDTLNGDRDRLYSRVTTLEQNLDSVTGAIAKQATMPVPSPSTAAATPGAPPVAVPPAQPVVPAPAPSVAPVASTQPVAPDKPAAPDKAASADSKAAAPTEKPAAAPEKLTAADKKPLPAGKSQTSADTTPPTAIDRPSAASATPAPAASPAASAASIAPDDGKPSAPTPSAPLVAEKSMIGPPDPAAGKLIEPIKPPSAKDVAAAPMATAAPTADDEESDEADAPKAQVQRTEFGVDLGSANSVNGLRALWRGLLKSKANATLAALRPIIVIKENSNGLGMQLRLVAGPLNDAGTAAKICAGLPPSHRSCETAIYEGQRLTLKPDEPPAASRPAQPHRRMLPKRAAAPPPVAEEKKPEPTTISSIFRRNSQ
ncbi:hypothetical protein IC762_18805 [Bradyrhizobium genosp. L]|uniref:hypothetical protein n=1 Tax=Bradyrhizobium genosp. L TaxID=83637 RepID=UPI0018A32593|nr:hypothetical protein [Bradyrhizobium genosp. L]QPF81855.1 hypothetical protein IC762_18805 [Bradyrhizobium genosp. L]